MALAQWSEIARLLTPEGYCLAQAAGLQVVELQRARCRMEFFNIGAVVWILRKCPWWVPDFTVTRYAGA